MLSWYLLWTLYAEPTSLGDRTVRFRLINLIVETGAPHAPLLDAKDVKALPAPSGQESDR